MAYARVEWGNVVERVGALPENWRNVSGLNRLSDAELKPLGWLPVTDTQPALAAFQEYGTPTIVVGADAVTYTYPVVNLSAAEAKAGLKAQWRDEFVTRLYRDYTAEEVVAMLVLAIAPAAFKTYVGNLRTAYTNAVAALNAATTREQALAIVPDWPV